MALLKLKIKINIFKEFQIVTPPYKDILEIILSVCAHVCMHMHTCGRVSVCMLKNCSEKRFTYFLSRFRYLVVTLVKDRELSSYFTSALFQGATEIIK